MSNETTRAIYDDDTSYQPTDDPFVSHPTPTPIFPEMLIPTDDLAKMKRAPPPPPPLTVEIDAGEYERLKRSDQWARRAKLIVERLQHLPKGLRRIADLLEELMKVPF